MPVSVPEICLTLEQFLWKGGKGREGRRWGRRIYHKGTLTIQGEKMNKSKGN